MIQLSPVQLVEVIVQQQLTIEKQQEIIEQLQQEIEKLKSSLKLDSRNSSKPPSTDLLKKSEKQKVKSAEETQGKGKPGGQAGHVGKTRKGFSRVDRYEIINPTQCQHCGSNTFEATPIKVQRQQVAQLVARPIEVVEYQKQTRACSCCGQAHTPNWPTSVVPGQDLSIELQSLLVWLGNVGHLSYEKQQELLKELGDIDIGMGTLQATNARMSEAVNHSVEQLREWVKQQPQLHIDESPWPVMGLKEWLWVMAGEKFCLFHAADTRSRAELIEQLGETFDGVISSDDYNVYNGYQVKAQQKCLAHLRRHFKKVVQLGHGNNPMLGQAFLALIDEAFTQHHQWRERPDLSSYQTWVLEFKQRLQQTIQQWIGKAGYEAGKLLRSLRDKAEQWWYFLDHPEVPPDNNLAERCLRLAVTKRKVSGGSRSLERFTQTANLLTVVQTCRLQDRSVVEFFQQAIVAISHKKDLQPSLVPTAHI